MKVLFIVNAYGKSSGAEHVLNDYLKTENRIEPLFLFIGTHKEVVDLFSDATERRNIMFIEAQSKISSPASRIAFFPLFRFFLCETIKKNDVYQQLNNRSDIDAVYFNNSFEAMTFYPLFPNKKKIVHIHDMIDMFRPAQKECIVSVCKKAPAIITVSEACKNMLVANGISGDKITVAHNSINLSPAPLCDTHSHSCLTLGFVGSAIQRKGFDTFIEITNKVNQELSSFNYGYRSLSIIVITNSDKNSSYLRENLQKLNSNIEIREFYGISREQVMALYREMDLLLVPSRYDPLPTVVLEAYLSGTPVLGTKKDGMLEMQVDQDMMFEPDDVNDAVAKIKRWVEASDEQKASIISDTQKHVMKEFTAEKKRDTIYTVLTKDQRMNH